MVINVRLEGPTEEAVRKAAEKAGVTLSNIKRRENCVQGYGTMVV